jgi:mono/diheme cytochrome c family protein
MAASGAAAAVLLLMGAAAVTAQDRPPEQHETPEHIWASSCGYCHGGPMNAPQLHGRQLPEAVIIAVVRNGANGMPPFHASAITDDDLRALARWIHEAPAPAPLVARP